MELRFSKCKSVVSSQEVQEQIMQDGNSQARQSSPVANTRPSGSELPSQGLPGSQFGSTFYGKHVINMEVLSASVRAQAVLTIGKMCIQVKLITV